MDEITKKIKEAHTPGGFLYDHFSKPLSLYTVRFFLKIKASPSGITLFGFFLDVLAAILILSLDFKFFFIPAILVLLAYHCDTCDGIVARITNKTSKYGWWLDEMLGISGQVLVFTAIILILPFTKFNILLGIAAIFGVLMMMLAAILSEVIYKDTKREIAESAKSNLKDKIRKITGIKINPKMFAFSCDMQRAAVAVFLIINPILVLYIFAIISNLYWLARFYFYWGKG